MNSDRFNIGSGYFGTVLLYFRSIANYRIEIIARILRGLIAPLATVILWEVIYATSKTTVINGFPSSQIFIYFFLTSALARIFPVVDVTIDMQSDIKSGDIATSLMRPMSYPILQFAASFGDPLVDFACLTLASFILVCAILGFIPAPVHVALFAIEIMLGFVLTWLLFFSIGCLAAYFVNIFGIMNVMLWVFNVLGGRLIPLTVFPTAIGSVLQLLPFGSVFYLPVVTLDGFASFSYIASGIAVTMIWIVIFFVMSSVIWRFSREKVMASGG